MYNTAIRIVLFSIFAFSWLLWRVFKPTLFDFSLISLLLFDLEDLLVEGVILGALFKPVIIFVNIIVIVFSDAKLLVSQVIVDVHFGFSTEHLLLVGAR